MYCSTVPLEIVLATERPFAAAMGAHILLYSLRVVRLQMGLKVESTRKG
jgi:hypothetical protein